MTVMPINVYDIGDMVRTNVLFTINSIAADPSAVTYRLKKPDGSVVTYTYLTGPEIVRAAQGSFQVDVSIDQQGSWQFGFYGTGNVEAAAQGSFMVRPQRA